MSFTHSNLLGRLLLLALLSSVTFAAQAVDKLYYNEPGTYTIKRQNLTTSGGEETVAGDNGKAVPRQVAVDGSNNYVYFIDTSAYDGNIPGIYRASMAAIPTTDFERIVDKGDDTLGDIVLDLSAGKIYYTRKGSVIGVFQANLDGSGQSTLVPDDGVIDPTLLAFDPQGQALFYLDAGGFVVKVPIANPSARQTIITQSKISGIAVGGDKLYYSIDGADGTVYEVRAWNLDGSGTSVAVGDDGIWSPKRIKVHAETNSLFWVQHTGAIYRADLTTGLRGQIGSGAINGIEYPWLAVPDYIPVVSSNADLSALSLSSGILDQPFDPDVTSYTADVVNEVASIAVTPTVADGTATVTVNGTLVSSGTASGAIALSVGDNTINVVVTAQDGITTKTYTVTVTRDKAAQSITFGALAPVTSGAAPFTLEATASSGLPVSYVSSNPGVATINDSTVTIVGVGTTTITASQAGNDSYLAADDVARELLVTNLPPVNNTLPALSGGTAVGTTFTTTAGDWSDPEGDAISYSYQWQRADDDSGTNSVDITDATTNSHTATTDDAHKYLRAAVTATDAPGAESTAYSAWSLVTNTPPELGGSFTTNGAVDDNATIAPFANVTVSDLDGDDITLHISYTAANGTLSGTGLTGSAGDYTLSATDAATQSGRLQALLFIPTENQVAPGNIVVTGFTLTPDDGSDSGSANGSTTVTATSVNDPPALDLNGAAGGSDYSTTFIPAGGPVPLADVGATLSDPDVGAQILSLTALIDATPNGTDEQLSLDAAATSAAADNALSVAFDSGTRALTISGTAAPAVYQDILRGIRYHNQADLVSIDFSDRHITFTAGDGTADSTPVTTTVAIKAAPIVDLNGGESGQDIEHTYTEGEGDLALAPEAALTEPNDANLKALLIELTNPQDGAEEAIGLTGRNHGDTVNGITITYTGGHQIELTGEAAAADYQSLLRELHYRHNGTTPEEATERTVTVQATNSSDDPGNIATARITIVNINEAPVLTATAPSLGTLAGQTSDAIVVSDFLGATDADRDPEYGIAITGKSGSGRWEYSLDGGATWADIGSVSEGNARLLRDTDHLRYARADGNPESATLDYRAWDRTDGSAGGFGDATVNGGSSAYSANSATATLTTELLAYRVQASAGSGGSVSPAEADILFGESALFTVTPNSGYSRSSGVGGDCPAGSWSGNSWTSGLIEGECSASFSFTENSVPPAPEPEPEPTEPEPEPEPQPEPEPEPEPEPTPEPEYDDGTTACYLSGCESTTDDEGRQVVSYDESDPESGTAVTVTTTQGEDGSLIHELTVTDVNGNTVTTRATSDLPGSRTTLERDESGQPMVVTRAELEDGTRHEVEARADGSAVHRVIRPDGTVTEAVSRIPGAETRIEPDGRVVTEAEERYVDATGEEHTVRVVVETAPSGEGTIRYERYDPLRGEWETLTKTVDPITPFEAGHEVVIEQGAQGPAIAVTTRVTRDIYF